MECCTYKQNCLHASVFFSDVATFFPPNLAIKKLVLTTHERALSKSTMNLRLHCEATIKTFIITATTAKKCSYQTAADTHAQASLLINLSKTSESLGKAMRQTHHVASSYVGLKTWQVKTNWSIIIVPKIFNRN